jgi:hypothetical protein
LPTCSKRSRPTIKALSGIPRALVVILAVQLALGGAVVFAATQGFFGAGGSSRTPRAHADRFHAERAWRLIGLQLAYGQRPAGSPQLRALAERLRPLLPNGRFEPVLHERGVRNVVGTLAGRRPGIVIGAHYDTLAKPKGLPGRRPAILIGAHYDSEAHPPGFVGANDSAAGTAAVLELARALRRPVARAGREVRFVLFDGEEEPPGMANAPLQSVGLRGSRAYAARHRGEVGEMVLLDYIANRGARFGREGGSDAALWGRLRAAARAAGVGRLFPASEQGVTILDDHTPFAQRGVPAVDVIDWGYRYRDTVEDTLDKLDRGVLDGVGEAVAELLRRGG